MMTQARGQTHLCGVWLTATFVVGEGSVMWWLCRVFGLGFLAVYEIERRWCKGGHPRSHHCVAFTPEQMVEALL